MPRRYRGNLLGYRDGFCEQFVVFGEYDWGERRVEVLGFSKEVKTVTILVSRIVYLRYAKQIERGQDQSTSWSEFENSS